MSSKRVKKGRMCMQNKKKPRSTNPTPFRRVSDIIDVDPRLQDNSFEAKVGTALYGIAAIQCVCVCVGRGKGFVGRKGKPRPQVH